MQDEALHHLTFILELTPYTRSLQPTGKDSERRSLGQSSDHLRSPTREFFLVRLACPIGRSVLLGWQPGRPRVYFGPTARAGLHSGCGKKPLPGPKPGENVLSPR